MKKLIILFFMILTVSGFSQNLGIINSQQNNVTVVTSTLYDSLVFWYEFNEKSGTTLIDSSGNALNGTITGAELVQVGKIDTSHLYLNTDKSVVPDDDKLSLQLDSMTISAWVYITSRSAINIIADKGNEYRLLVNTDGKLNWRILDGNAGTYMGRTTVENIIMENTWYHIVVTYNKSFSRDGLKLYVNNVQKDVYNTGNASIAEVSNFATNLEIGYSTAIGSGYLQGYLDQLIGWNKLLTVEEINELNNVGRGIKYGN